MNLDDLRKIAEKATPGPWITGGELPGSDGVFFGTVVDPDDPDEPGILLGDAYAPDAEFIATFNPELVVALLDRVEKAEQEAFDFVKQKAKEGAREKRELESRVRKAERALQRVRELYPGADDPCAPKTCTHVDCEIINALEGDE